MDLLFDSKLLLPQLQRLSMPSLRKIDSCNIALGLGHDLVLRPKRSKILQDFLEQLQRPFEIAASHQRTTEL